MEMGGSGGIASSPGTEDGKFARRRSRRVSFADTTAVHVFDRDEDFETPPEEREAGSPSPSPRRSSAGREDEDETEEDFHPPPVIFLRDVDSSSPGSAAGSMVSADDDDENFFGPVSASFIQTGRPSDSGISDENFFGPVSASFIQTGRPSDSGISEDDRHDITMDSRTFSMHFRNIAPPDDCTANSAASLMTPNTASEGPLKELTASNSARTSINGQDTLTDMSLLSGKPRTYHYDELSPSLRSMVKKIDGSQQTNSPKNCNHDHMDVDPGANDAAEPPAKISPAYKSFMSNGDVQSHLVDQSLSKDEPSGSKCTSVSSMPNVDMATHLLDQPPGKYSTDAAQSSSAATAILPMDAEQLRQKNGVMDTETVLHTPRTAGLQLQVPQGSVSSLSSKRQKLFTTTVSNSKVAMCNVDMATHLLDQPPGKDSTDAAQSSSAATAILPMDAEQLRQKNGVMDTETVLHTPRTAGLQLQVPQGSVSSLSSKRQKLFTTTVSNSKVAMCNVDMATHLLDQPPGKDSTDAAQSSSAATAISLMDAEQLRQKNGVMDTETVLHTPRIAGLQLQVPQGSVSSLRSKRQKLFTTAVSNSKLARQEGCSLGTEFVEHDKRISSLRLQELPAASRLQLAEKNELGHRAGDMFSNTEYPDSTLSVSPHSVPKLKRTSESFILGTPRRHGLNESTKVPDTSCHVLALDSRPSREHNSHLNLDGVGRRRTAEENGHAVQECPEETAKTARSPRQLRKVIPCVSQPSPVIEEKKNGAHDKGKSVDIDWNKVVCTITNATDQVLSASISKYNIQQLDMLSDKLDEIHVANKFKRLSDAVRIKDFCGDKQKRLEEARFLHDKLFYEKAKLQIYNMKLVKLQKKAQLYQDRIQESCFLKSVLGAAQMKDASLPAATSVSANDRQEELAIISEKRLELKNIQQKVEKLRSSHECFHNIKGEIGSDSVVRYAEEQLMMRNQHRVIHRQAGFCKLHDIVKRDNKRDVTLNYHNFLFQRIILNVSDTGNIFVNNSVNGNHIGQIFPNLNASLAFNFVFKAEENQRVSDLRSLQQKITETSLLLGNLIDVLDEIKLSKFELLNLTSAGFVLESQTCKLGLHLSFLSLKSVKKIAFIIDMTDLNRSVYPCDPSELPIEVCKAQTTLAQPSIDETMASIRNLEPGRTAILRLCRMVSRVTRGLP